jgi:hypothetical protein
VSESHRGEGRLRRDSTSDLAMWKPGWRTKVLAAVAGGLCMLLSLLGQYGYAWGGAITSAGAALIVPVLGLRRLWHQGRFWAVVAVLAVAQVPLVIALRPRIAKGGLATMLAFGAVDCLFVCLVIFSTSKSGG